MSKSTKNQAFLEFAKELAFERRTVEVQTSSGRKFVLRELDGSEQVVVDKLGTDFDPTEIFYLRVVAAIISVNDKDVPEMKGKEDFLIFLRALRSSELDEMSKAYNSEFVAKGEKLKDSSSETASSE